MIFICYRFSYGNHQKMVLLNVYFCSPPTQAQAEAQRAVVKFHRANGIYRAAKETVALAEERLMSAGDNGEKREFDSAWQEMLNHATIKVGVHVNWLSL